MQQGMKKHAFYLDKTLNLIYVGLQNKGGRINIHLQHYSNIRLIHYCVLVHVTFK